MRAMSVPVPNRKRTTEQMAFGGYTHNVNAQEGSIWDEANISGRLFPYLRPIRSREKLPAIQGTNGIFAHNALGWIKGREVWYDGHLAGYVQDSEKQIAVMGNRIVIWPDKVVLNASYKRLGVYPSLAALQQAVPAPEEFDCYGVGSSVPYKLYAWNGKAWDYFADELAPMEISKSFTGVQFKNGTYQGVNVKANTMEFPVNVEELGFKEGDGLTISGCTKHPENNKTVVVQEIEGRQMRCYDYAFKLDGEQGITDYTEPGTITISREVPEMDVICAYDNRLWGAKDDTIYASKQGDPTNFNVFSGLTTDSWFQTTGTAGSFSGCTAFRGCPIFFKPNYIFKVFGKNAENFQPQKSATMGVRAGAGKSLAVAGEVLYYLSDNGLIAYSGGVPQSMAAPFGTVQYKDCCSGSDGRRLYLSMEREDGGQELFCLDSLTGLLCKEDNAGVIMWCCHEGQLLGMTAAGTEIFNEDTGAGCPDSMVEFADIADGTMDRKSVTRLQVRVYLEAGASLALAIQYNSDGIWRPVKTLRTTRKQSFVLPVRISRCDHWRLRLQGVGYWELQQLGKTVYIGSGVH